MRLLALELARLAVLGNHPGELLAELAADLHEVADHGTFIPFAQLLVAKFE